MLIVPSLPTLSPRRIAALAITAAMTFHLIPGFWWHHTTDLFRWPPTLWSHGLAMILLGLALTIWSPSAFGLTWARSWTERRTVGLVGGGIAAVAVLGMLFIHVPFYGQSPAIFVCIPLYEELFFRGFIFGVLGDAFPATLRVGHYRFASATILSGIAFGLWHLGGLRLPADGFIAFQVVYTTIAGVLFAYLREVTGSLWPSWVVHTLVDAWAVLVPGFWSLG